MTITLADIIRAMNALGTESRVLAESDKSAESGKQEAKPVAWPSAEDAAIKACALMIKGICLTKPQDEWTAQIEKRIRFMLNRGSK